ncbi:MAG: M1 family metallopeptidase [Balneolales bacterium]
MRFCLLSALAITLFASAVSAQHDILDSGGKLLPEQASYNVHYYDLDIFIEPADSSIHGNVITHAEIVHPLDHFVLDLDTVFTVHRVSYLGKDRDPGALHFEIKNGQIWASFPETRQPGDRVMIEVEYEGKPRTAPNPPWEGGFTWEETSDGQPWIGVTSQLNGADIWWPVKDHPSDRADSVSLNITVPDPLVAAGSGKLREVVDYDNGFSTYKWFVSTPINNYSLSLNVAPYEVIECEYTSITGKSFPMYFWVLPENYDKAEKLFVQIKEQMTFFEKYLGPYPFRADKYGVAEAPYLGMEHQTLIAYGAGYQNDVLFNTGSGFDDLHHHELAHEWWGNMVSVYDWRDFWVHEGFATYMQPLFAEHLHGKDQYHTYMEVIHSRINNSMPVAARDAKSTREMYANSDVYMKGAWFLHTLRFLIGDNDFFKALKLMSYPDPTLEMATDGSSSRFATTEDFLTIAEHVSGRQLEWLFEVYLRQSELPILNQEREENKLKLSWSIVNDMPFPMPVEIKVNGSKKLVQIPSEGAILTLDKEDTLEVDPDHWILRE